jgi:hypothetical protein
VISKNEKASNEIARGRSQGLAIIVFIIYSPADGGKRLDRLGDCKARLEKSISNS